MKKFPKYLSYKLLIILRGFLVFCMIIEVFLLSSIIQGFSLSLSLNPIKITATRLASCPEYVDLDFFLEFISKKLNVEPNIDTLVDAKIIQPSEKDFITEQPSLSRAIIWRIIFPVYNLYPYPATFYPEFNLNSKDFGQIYLDSCATALAYNLTTPGDSIYQYMSLTEFDKLTAFLDTNPSLPTPTAPVDCPLVNLDGSWNSETYLGRNSLLSAWEIIPENWCEDFIHNYWRFSFSLPDTTTSDQQASRYGISGVINYQQKIIFLGTANTDTTIHELTHFAAHSLGWNDSFLNLFFQHESSHLVGILDEYAFTSHREYLAEFVTYWLMHPDEQTILNSLAPQTSAITIKLISSYISTAAP